MLPGVAKPRNMALVMHPVIREIFWGEAGVILDGEQGLLYDNIIPTERVNSA